MFNFVTVLCLMIAVSVTTANARLMDEQKRRCCYEGDCCMIPIGKRELEDSRQTKKNQQQTKETRVRDDWLESKIQLLVSQLKRKNLVQNKLVSLREELNTVFRSYDKTPVTGTSPHEENAMKSANVNIDPVTGTTEEKAEKTTNVNIESRVEQELSLLNAIKRGIAKMKVYSELENVINDIQ